MLAAILAMVEDEASKSKLEDMYDTYGHRMYRIAYRILNDHHLAEDSVQLAFEKIIKHLHTITEIHCNRTSAFLVIVVRSTSIDLYRKRKTCENSLEDYGNVLPSEEASLDDRVISAEMFDMVMEKVKLLPEHYGDIITLKYVYQHSDEEISQILNITRENVRVRLSRARQNLIKLLNGDEVG